MNKFYPKKHEYLIPTMSGRIHDLGLQESLFEKLFICKKWPLSIDKAYYRENPWKKHLPEQQSAFLFILTKY